MLFIPLLTNITSVTIQGGYNEISPLGISRTSYILALFILLTIHQSYLLSQQRTAKHAKLNVAVMDFDAREGLTKGEAATLSDVLNSELVKSNEFTIVDRNRIKAILTEQGFQQSEACSQVECVVEAGKILKVEKMFVGVVGRIGKMYNVNIQVVDVSTAQIERNISRQHSGDIEELATDIIPDMASQLIKEMTGKEIAVSGLIHLVLLCWCSGISRRRSGLLFITTKGRNKANSSTGLAWLAGITMTLLSFPRILPKASLS